MIFSYEWLKELLPEIPSPEEILETMTSHSVEVEEIIDSSQSMEDVVVGELLEVQGHPKADSLHIGKFDVGEKAPRQIIFGGVAELEVGQKIPIALAPTTLPGGVKIKKVKLRGEESQGMCCLNSELGILDKQDDVHTFDANEKNGTPIQDILGAGQVLIDIDNKSMTHRSDLFCHNNMAQEIAAVFSIQAQLPEYKTNTVSDGDVNVKIQDHDLCPRYIGTEIEVTVEDSPDFILRRLRACGVKTINNVVDITNYVMLEMGEPLHAFDLDKLDGEQIVVRRAKKGEVITTLDNDKKLLDDSMLVIADKTKPVAIAGVIGDIETSVTKETKRILLEAANFEPIQVRKTAQKLATRTEGVIRWEKGVPPELAEYAAMRAVELLEQYADAKVIAKKEEYPENNTKPEAVSLHALHINRLAGMPLPNKTVKDILQRLGCEVKMNKAKDTVFQVTPPWYRMDLGIQEDFIEEIIRLYGVNNLPEQKVSGELEVPDQEQDLPLVGKIREELRLRRCVEVYNYSFYGEELMSKIGLLPDKEHIEILNPLSDDLRYLRTSVLPRMVENVQLNQHHRNQFSLFEIGHVYFSDREVRQCGILTFGDDDPFRAIRGIVESLMHALHIDVDTSVSKKSVPCEYWGMYQDDHALLLSSSDQMLGTVGVIDNEVLQQMKIKSGVGFAALSVASLLKVHSLAEPMKPISPYPEIPLDLSIIVPESVQWEDINRVVQSHAKEMLQSIEVFDVYRGKGIEQGTKSVAFHLVLQSFDRTLEMAEIEKWRDDLVKKLAKKLSAELREK